MLGSCRLTQHLASLIPCDVCQLVSKVLRVFTVDTLQATPSQAEPILVFKYASVLKSGGFSSV